MKVLSLFLGLMVLTTGNSFAETAMGCVASRVDRVCGAGATMFNSGAGCLGTLTDICTNMYSARVGAPKITPEKFQASINELQLKSSKNVPPSLIKK